MRQAWRWYGPDDPVTLDHVRQAGAREIVTALHQYAPGVPWPREAVAARKALIENAPRPHAAALDRGREHSGAGRHPARRAGAARAIEAWIESMRAVAAEDIRIICYNVMPVVDWTRTDLDFPLPTGATALRFDHDRFAAFDLHVLEREGAEADYDAATQARARKVFDAMGAGRDRDADEKHLGRAARRDDVIDESRCLRASASPSYRGITPDKMRANVVAFLEQVTPVAEQLGVRLTLHPDDPPRPLFGLPRIASTAADYQALFDAVPSAANGICLCVGSLGAPRRTTTWCDGAAIRRAHLFRASALDPDRRRRRRASASPRPIISTAT